MLSSSCIRCGPIDTPLFFKRAARLQPLESRSFGRRRYSNFFDGHSELAMKQKTNEKGCRLPMPLCIVWNPLPPTG